MLILSFIVQLAGATMLLLYAVRMVRTGIERAFGSSFHRVITRNRNPVSAAAAGLVLAIVLQSSAAVALLVAGFSAAGTLGFGAGLAVVLGADLGSSLLIQVLSFDLNWLVPVLLAAGGGLFVRSTQRRPRQFGRIILGIAFILISLRFLRETMDPIRDSAFLPAIAGYLANDFVTAFVVGAFLAFIMHSSVAVILMCVTLVGVQAIPESAGVSLVLGANLGSAVIPIWLSRGMSAVARRVPLANFAVRGSGAILAVVAVNQFDLLPWLGQMGSAQTLINAHILFNAILLLWLPFCGLLERPFARLLPEAQESVEDRSPIYRSALDDSMLNKPHLAIANLRREVLRMLQLVETMIAPVMDLYDDYDPQRARAVTSRDRYVNAALDDIRRYAAAIPTDPLSKTETKRLRELTEYAIALEVAGDIVVKRLVPLAKEMREKGIKFSPNGRVEISHMHEKVQANIVLASNLLISDDLESARLLLEEKQEMARLERKSRKRHLKRLGEGVQISFDSSDIHLETVGSLRDFNSHVASAAYPILHRGGQLLETRLIEQDFEDYDIRER
ncbi:Na/Pi cotransporter family protein [Roseovarius spongiae]|uniref:Na/Pi cotransporter family protein n=1 Tax=Roseovarius spongiae TaxID=2320272 RepID=A0A3A8AY65_9RHOB|nr:Na/Pi cotransporter family protein [Roseovarius spongiae]RKF16786.1 Na/Pi cotransporter family protein [Roseovarius spongiae]